MNEGLDSATMTNTRKSDARKDIWAAMATARDADFAPDKAVSAALQMFAVIANELAAIAGALECMVINATNDSDSRRS